MIRTHDLSKSFGDLMAVDTLNLDIPQGEFFACLGPNGAGKTTTIRMLTGLIKPTSGYAEIAGFNIQNDPEKAKGSISYVPDFPFLYDKLTPDEFIQFVGEIFLVKESEIARKREELFEKLHLEEYRNQFIENLSHGTKQRVVIASALLHDPRVIVIDEPMVGLDPTHARIVKDELKERSRNGTTIFLSTHTLSVAEEVADRIGIINHGKLVAQGTVEELRVRSKQSGALESIFLALLEEGTDSPAATEA